VPASPFSLGEPDTTSSCKTDRKRSILSIEVEKPKQVPFKAERERGNRNGLPGTGCALGALAPHLVVCRQPSPFFFLILGIFVTIAESNPFFTLPVTKLCSLDARAEAVSAEPNSRRALEFSTE